MADQLGKVQECVDQLTTQMFICLHWVATNAVPQPIDGQPYQPPEGILAAVNGMPNPATETQESGGVNGVSNEMATGVDPDAAMQNYRANLRELAQDMVTKEQQIEMLVRELPGLDRSRNDQEQRMKELEEEATVLEDQAKEASEAREDLVQRVEEMMMKVRRV